MKIFDKATLKLTAVYTAVIMVISIGFSVCLGMVTVGELKRPYDVPSLFKELRVDEDFTRVYQVRSKSVESKVWASLTLININMLIVGIALSYLLARWTLRPIERAMDDETRFVSDASHELRTPLATMRMENEVLLRDTEAKKSDYKEQLKSNLEEIDKLRQLTDTLLRLSGSSKLEMGIVDASNVVASAVERISHAAEVKNIAVDNKIGHFMLNTNEDAISEIVYIFLDNAVKYAPADSTVEIYSSDKKSISVCDHGPGIADKDLPNIFNRFYRADESRNSEGFGLGLSLASRMAEQLNGKVQAANNGGKNAPGATFTVKLK